MFAIISLLSIYSARTILPSYLDNLVLKQLLWYLLGFGIIAIMLLIGNGWFYNNAWILYSIGIASLIGLLIFGTPINNARCWFNIPFIGTIQPAEFMKIILIIVLAHMLNDFNTNYRRPNNKEEFIFLLKAGLVVLIPSILTFLQPDTGIVLIYILITVVMLFAGGIRYRWFIGLLIILIVSIGGIVFLYFNNQELFIKILGNDFFLRIDRLLEWRNKSGYQLTNGINAIGSGGLFGNGLNNTPLYFPEAQNDFIFAVYSSNFGFIGSLFLIIIIIYFDLKLIIIAIKSRNNIDKYVISGIVGMLIYQQFQNIGMTFGLLPITGITLPFISYGGSSLISYMIMAGIVFNIVNKKGYYSKKKG